jgi:hypothetical protein
MLDFAWDADTSPSHRLVLKSKLLPGELSAEFKLLDHEGLVTANYAPNAAQLDWVYNTESGTLRAEYVFEAGNYGLEASIISTIPVLAEASINARHMMSLVDNKISSQVRPSLHF